MPNTENINRLIDVLKAHPNKFKMSRWHQGGGISPISNDVRVEQLVHNCGTAACLGGWAQALAEGQSAEGFLGITGHHHNGGWSDDFQALQYRQLFYMDGARYGLDDVDRLPEEQRAAAGIRVLEILRDEGTVQWNRALEEVGVKL